MVKVYNTARLELEGVYNYADAQVEKALNALTQGNEGRRRDSCV